MKFYLWEKDDRWQRAFTKAELEKPSWQRPERWIFAPSGELTFTIDEHWDNISKKNWRDKDGKPLESQLNEVVSGLFSAAFGVRTGRLVWEQRERQHREAEHRRREAERRRREELARIKALEDQADMWTHSQSLRSFIGACERELTREGRPNENSREVQWLRWATTYAESLNPLTNGAVLKAIAELPVSISKTDQVEL